MLGDQSECVRDSRGNVVLARTVLAGFSRRAIPHANSLGKVG